MAAQALALALVPVPAARWESGTLSLLVAQVYSPYSVEYAASYCLIPNDGVFVVVNLLFAVRNIPTVANLPVQYLLCVPLVAQR
jgi:hypothetical protein